MILELVNCYLFVLSSFVVKLMLGPSVVEPLPPGGFESLRLPRHDHIVELAFGFRPRPPSGIRRSCFWFLDCLKF